MMGAKCNMMIILVVFKPWTLEQMSKSWNKLFTTNVECVSWSYLAYNDECGYNGDFTSFTCDPGLLKLLFFVCLCNPVIHFIY